MGWVKPQALPYLCLCPCVRKAHSVDLKSTKHLFVYSPHLVFFFFSFCLCLPVRVWDRHIPIGSGFLRGDIWWREFEDSPHALLCCSVSSGWLGHGFSLRLFFSSRFVFMKWGRGSKSRLHLGKNYKTLKGPFLSTSPLTLCEMKQKTNVLDEANYNFPEDDRMKNYILEIHFPWPVAFNIYWRTIFPITQH